MDKSTQLLGHTRISKEFIIKLDDALGINECLETKKEKAGTGTHNPNDATEFDQTENKSDFESGKDSIEHE